MNLENGHHYRPAPVTREVRQKVDDIFRRLKGMRPGEIEGDAELNRLMERFMAVLSTPEMVEKRLQREAAIVRKPSSKPELMRIDYSMEDNAEGRAFLEALVSDDPERMEAYMLNKLDGAIFEFAFDPDLKRSSTGVGFQPPTKLKANPAAGSGQGD